MNNERNGGSWSLLSIVFCVVVVVLFHAACGCATKGAKVVEGVDFTAGVNIPAAEGMAELSLVNYLSGFRLSADRNYGLNCEFESTNTFSFAFGLYESWGVKRFKARCRPRWPNMPPSAVPKQKFRKGASRPIKRG